MPTVSLKDQSSIVCRQDQAASWGRGMVSKGYGCRTQDQVRRYRYRRGGDRHGGRVWAGGQQHRGRAPRIIVWIMPPGTGNSDVWQI